jgi:thiol-disulfide isomerase/thioredoxin
MVAELLTSARYALRLLPLAFIFIVPSFAVAQSQIDYCEMSPTVKEDMKGIDKLFDEDLPFKLRAERQLALFPEVLKKHPNDLHVRRRYLETRLGAFSLNRDALLGEYREQKEKNPNDPIAVFLYMRLLVGRDTKEVIKLANQLLQDAPQFSWSHLQLAEIYSTPGFRDPKQLKEHLSQWFAQCPTQMAGFSLVSRSGDNEMMSSAAQRIRARLESSTKDEDLAYWDQLWTLEFKLKPVPEHPQLRAQIAEDVKWIRARNLNNQQWLEALRAGYKQAGDKAGERWAQDEVVRLFPQSAAARRVIQGRFYEAHPYPKGEAPEADRQAYYRAVVDVTSEWIKRWPNDESTWSNRVRSLIPLEGASTTEVENAYNAYAKAHDRGGMSYSIPPLEISVARFYLKHDFHLANVPGIILKGLADVEQFDKSTGQSDLYPRPATDDFSNLKFMRLDAWPLLAEAYARLKEPEKAQAVLAKLAEITAPKKSSGPLSDREKRSAAYNESVYWRATGKVAEIEKRKLDALTAYQTALALNPPRGGKDELDDTVQRLWKELGGTDEGWKAYFARNDVSKTKITSSEVATWDSKNTVLAEFDLTDLEGRKWSLSDLKGKVAFINFWATWCSPCRAELPYVQKLREQLKDRKDVIILTLNTDEEVGKVEPFMKENKFTFPVLLGQAYADSQGINSIPRNWVVSLDGKVLFEGIGFGSEGEEWMKRATQLIEKVKGTN